MFNRYGQRMGATALSREQIMRAAPSVFAETPAESTSDRYLFIPTVSVVEQIESQGFTVVSASQSRAKSAEGKAFVQHMLRFRRTEDLSKQILNAEDSVTELCLTNSHNGTSAFRLNLGLWRQVCSNGLIASDTLASEAVRHTGYSHDKIIDAQYRVLSKEDQLVEGVEAMRGVELSMDERLLLANAALDFRYSEGQTKPRAEQLLRPRRIGDQGKDLWSTFNVIQENMMKGGLRTITQTETGRIRRNSTREVASVTENKRLNQALWALAEEMRKLKVGA